MAIPEISRAVLSEYEHIVLVDKSGSMGDPSKRIPGKTRWEEAQEHIKGLCNITREVDENGIDIILLSGEIITHRHIKTPEEVTKIFTTVQPKGSTDLAAAIAQAESIRASSGGKKFFFHILTDGEPNSKPAVKEAIAKSVKTMKSDGDLAFNFLQIGDDPAATTFLKELDDNLKTSMNLEFDAVNTMTAAESENLSWEQIMYQALND